MNQPPSGARGSEALWDWNLESNRVHFSARWISLVGCEEHEVGNKPEDWLQRVHPEDLAEVMRHIDAARVEEPGEFSFRHRIRHKNGTYRWVSCRGGVVVRNERGQAVRLMGCHSDVTVDTVTDPVTGLPNRLLFVDRLTRSIERSRRNPGFHFAVVLLDLGRPARRVASTGSITGDPLLTAAARRLETCLRVGDMAAAPRDNDFVARLQDDQFAVLFDGLKDVRNAKILADRILKELLDPVNVSGQEVLLSASMGVAVSATGYTRAEDVLRDAETALHRARMLGGSHCEVFDTAILKTEHAELQLEGDFVDALERREFQLLYEPIVSLASNQIVGFEALVRWQHPGLGTILPADFIPIAERTGFIAALGRWIVNEACIQMKAWQDRACSPGLWISVNLSVVQLQDPALAEHVREALGAADLEARGLVLEVTEGVAIENLTAASNMLMQLRGMGVRIAIDDFGTGYSSLAYLRQLPVDVLKVDQSFVRGIESQRHAADIIRTLTTMARQLGLHVVAEGIENDDQLTLLRSLQCDSGQGYLFSRPLDTDGVTALLEKGLGQRVAAADDSNRVRSLLTFSEPQDIAGRSWVGRWIPVSAATAVLLTSAGLVARLSTTPRPVSETSSATVLQGMELATGVGSIASAPRPNVSPETAPGSAPSAPPTASTATSAQPPSLGNSTKPAESSPARPATAQSPANAVTSVNVVHLHRVGGCEGRLVVSRDGVAFLPDEPSGKDVFEFKYGEFLHTLDGDRLTIRSNTRTYRFKAAVASDGNGDKGVDLRDVVARIAQRR